MSNMKEKYLIIVESPTKARTISRFLPKNFIVEASIGHVRDLPQNASDIPASKKSLEWARLGINVEQDFEPLYITPRNKGKIITGLRKKLKGVQGLYLATDEDREGESISWHLVQLLKPEKQNIPVKRMVFHEITRTAITEALAHTRDIDMNLVRAQEARRILDRLYGFTLSPLIWKKIAYGLSAGRVQSPGLRMIVERERERSLFKKAVYWSMKATLSTPETNAEGSFEARLISVKEKRLVTGKDFDPNTGKISDNNLLNPGEEEILQLAEKLMKALWRITGISEKENLSHPAIPFITSTLQQEGNRKLGLSARETMRAAQKLYEEGFITYMRTDSPTLSGEAIQGARQKVQELYGKNYLSKTPRQYSSKNKNAQEAHEAIRPAGSQFISPDDTGLDGREKSLYTLIWKRTLATQMAAAVKSSTVVKIQAEDAVFQANGTKILFPGFLRLYGEDGNGRKKERKESDDIILPDLKKGQQCEVHRIDSRDHETRPPTRYTEASLIQNLEKLGIGRPSTYSSIIGTLFDRSYVRKARDVLIPSFTGIAVAQFLEKNFDYLITYDFTSEMEENLDHIAIGEKNHLDYLRKFYCGKKGLEELVKQREAGIGTAESRRISLPGADEKVEIRVGRFGPYIVAKGPDGKTINASIPEDIAPSDLSNEDIKTLIDIQIKGPEPIGVDPESGKSVFCLSGRFGFYFQLGKISEEEPKPRRASIPRDRNPKDISLEEALKYLSIPKVLGVHPETGQEIRVAIGRFGPFVAHDGEFRSLKKTDDIYTIDLKRALELLSEVKATRRWRSNLIKELGEHSKKPVGLYSGKYGPYLKYGTKNIPLPEDKKDEKDLANLTLEEGVKIIKAWAKNKEGSK